MKTMWARIGRQYNITDEDYERIEEAIQKNDSNTVTTILEKSEYYDDGDSYLPPNCNDNPNDYDFSF